MSETSELILCEHLGEIALAYLLAIDAEALRERLEGEKHQSLGQRREAILSELVQMDGQLQEQQHSFGLAGAWAAYLAGPSVRDPTTSVGNFARKLCGGKLPTIQQDWGDLESRLVQMSVNIYPGLIVRQPEDSPARRMGPALSLYGYPMKDEFERLARADRDLGRLFSHEETNSGPGGYVARSTGREGGLQLWLLADHLIRSAWSVACLKVLVPDVELLADSVLSTIQVLRRSIKGETASIPARLGLTGVLFPNDVEEIDLGWCRIRRADARDDIFVSTTALRGILSRTDEGGEAVAIKYSGDLVLEMDVPFSLQIHNVASNEEAPRAATLTSLEEVEAAVEILRLALILASPGQRLILHPTWRAIIEPFSYGIADGWNDVTRAVGLSPARLSSHMVDDWVEWANLIKGEGTTGIEVAVRRMLASVADRRASVDILVDAVIVWENLFGGKTETTLRVTSSLAWLLGETPEDRLAKQDRYKKIYDYRSRVVHGESKIDEALVQGYSEEAVRIAGEALATIFKFRPELLKITTSEKRSLAIMLRG